MTGGIGLIFPGAEVDKVHYRFSVAAILPGGDQSLVADALLQWQCDYDVGSHSGWGGLLDYHFRLAAETDVALCFWP